ncbi:Hydrolase, alpha/beta fold family functionally coupled to Phosphoribulokinase [Pseudonocardia sp. Ae168_Ps1]|uniref:alpha/beta fold hydrolase n=1 Tax=unclassified Pseudonocardia TaxID=2619320 RepID=UPI00096132BB|nr:Hydrolase, alpha/beta fold family functionally coupled to Phosphoribulokinase [Pseudonocardia sp. Ae150A_Ps1]OLL82815.1 Hydrolase, alpha/beta fold family functionally coupled to Phosphoribulokinase [Pseudonocardia sp. Ae168_Ps1]OLL83072.1 Hydrolase, alpha/beta fold family functionally coupled to Phosphoribulokinase [Pseudonocardia sp. Ae263_Ps1]OLL90889.1 Hydrolase, alpha/beta fold family functionally coupled to Phosphoribulokinase [Pseudonocardia sp. Ae356_Ps1]
MAVRDEERRAVGDRLGMVPPRGSELRFRTVHGYRRAFRVAGSGPPIVLVHGIGDSSATWEAVLPALARRFLVIAPDLLGHGHSDKPRADYSVAAYANGIRDLLGVLGVPRATLVGHSLGGGVAMQFAYQYPDRTERLVLVGSGGAGPEVTPLLRAVSLPGAQAALAALQLPPVRWQAGLVLDLLRVLGADLGRDATGLLRLIDALPDATSRAAFIRTLRAVVDWRGQVVTMLDRCYLTRGMPTMLVWGGRDAVVPVEHGYTAHRAMPGSRLEVFDDAGHFPFHSDPARFVGLLEEFLDSTEPARWSPEQWRQLLRCPAPVPARPGPVSAT